MWSCLTFIICLILGPIRSLRTSLPGELRLAPHAPSPAGKRYYYYHYSIALLHCSLDLKDIKVVSKLGGTIDDSEMIDGMVFDHKAAKSAGGPTKIENAKIGLIQFQISPPKTDLENKVIISDYAQMDRILKEERNYILQMIKKIRATGCNVLLIQKSILRDAVTELSLHYLVNTALHMLVELTYL